MRRTKFALLRESHGMHLDVHPSSMAKMLSTWTIVAQQLEELVDAQYGISWIFEVDQAKDEGPHLYCTVELTLQLHLSQLASMALEMGEPPCPTRSIRSDILAASVENIFILADGKIKKDDSDNSIAIGSAIARDLQRQLEAKQWA